jgi:hypothetical protein
MYIHLSCNILHDLLTVYTNRLITYFYGFQQSPLIYLDAYHKFILSLLEASGRIFVCPKNKDL